MTRRRKRKHAIKADGILAYKAIGRDGKTFIRIVMRGKNGSATLDVSQGSGRKFGQDLIELGGQEPLETMKPMDTA